MDKSVSVLLPSYNWDVTNLVHDLHKQLSAAQIPFEILCIDNSENSTFIEKNNLLNALSFVNYAVNTHVDGRAENRNLLAQQAQHNYILFLDGDADISQNPSFIANYLAAAKPDVVLCGGTAYGQKPTSSAYFLRYQYGISREVVAPLIRQKNPWRGFSAFNFFMSRNQFNGFGFNEKLSEYGHEDTLFGYELKHRCITVNHINNTAIHLGLDDNRTFLAKTKKAIVNLRGLIDAGLVDEDVTLFAWYFKLHNKKLDGILASLYKAFGQRWETNLCGQNPNMRIFDIYKLGYLCSLPHAHGKVPVFKI